MIEAIKGLGHILHFDLNKSPLAAMRNNLNITNILLAVFDVKQSMTEKPAKEIQGDRVSTGLCDRALDSLINWLG